MTIDLSDFKLGREPIKIARGGRGSMAIRFT